MRAHPGIRQNHRTITATQCSVRRKTSQTCQESHRCPRYDGHVTTGTLRSSREVRSNHTFRYNGRALKDLMPFFRAMTQLRRLSVQAPLPKESCRRRFESAHFWEVFSAVSPTLIEFATNHTPSSPAIPAFLQSHPNLRVWCLGACGEPLSARRG